MSVNGNWKHTEDNDWNTPKMVWDKIIPFMDKEKVYWLPFYNDGYAGKYLTEKGFKVIHRNEDFWNNMYDDVVVVDNPPYKVKGIVKIKKKIMERLIKNNIPFMLLYPTTTIQTAYFKDLQDGKFQLLIPQEKYNYEKYEGDNSRCLFYTLWICWNMKLKNDMIII